MLNIDNLIETNNENESMDNALTVSQTYDLLNENVNVTWNEAIIKLKSPYSLNTISSISFRSFTGELLPYTTLELPTIEFGIKALLSKSLNYPSYLKGTDNIFIKNFISLLNQYNNSTDNIIYQNTKIFTYDSSSDLQIDYNINEIINFLNEIFNEWLGSFSHNYILGGYYNFDRLIYTTFFNYTPFNLSSGNLAFINNAIVRIPYFNSSNELSYYTYDISNQITGYTPYFCSSSIYTNQILIHLDKSSNSEFIYLIYENSTLIKTYIDFYVDCDLWNNDIKTIPHAYVKTASKNYLIIMPDFFNTSISIIYNNKISTISSGFNVYNYYLILSITYENDSRIFITYLGYNNAAEVYIERGYISLLSGFTYSSDFEKRLITTDEYNYFKACNVCNLSLGLTWNVQSFATSTHDMILETSYRTIIDTKNRKCKILYCEFIDDINDETYMLTNKTPLNISHERVIRKTTKSLMKTANELYNAYTFGIWNYLHLGETIKFDNSINPIAKIIPTNNNFIQSVYLDNYIINYSVGNYLKDFTSYYYNSKEIYPSNTINNNLSIETNKCFSIDTDTGVFNYPVIYFDESTYISFIPFIKTNPLYFNIEFKQNDLNIKSYSIFNNTGIIKSFEINKHIINTIEALILLKYETNDLKLRCMNFPNNDNIVFSLNEVANVNFKSFNINATGIELICSIIDNENNNIDKDTLKRLYGKLVINIDFKS